MVVSHYELFLMIEKQGVVVDHFALVVKKPNTAIQIVC
jgi:ribosomal protein S12